MITTSVPSKYDGKTATISIATSVWSSKTATISCSIVTASNNIIVTPITQDDAIACSTGQVWCTAQAAGTLTFVCTTVPTAAIGFNVMALD